MLLELHFAENAFALELFLQSPEGLFDVVVADTDLHVVVTTFLVKVALMCRLGAHTKARPSCPLPPDLRVVCFLSALIGLVCIAMMDVQAVQPQIAT
jgi:hypothetical protein